MAKGNLRGDLLLCLDFIMVPMRRRQKTSQPRPRNRPTATAKQLHKSNYLTQNLRYHFVLLNQRQVANFPPVSGSTDAKVLKSLHDLSIHDAVHVSWTNE